MFCEGAWSPSRGAHLLADATAFVKDNCSLRAFEVFFKTRQPAGNISVSSIEAPEGVGRISGIGETLIEGKELVLSGPVLAGALAGPTGVDSGRAEPGSTTGRGGWEGSDIAIRNER